MQSICSSFTKQAFILLFLLISVAICLVLLLVEQNRWRTDEWDLNVEVSNRTSLQEAYLSQKQLQNIQDAKLIFRVLLVSATCSTIVISLVTLVMHSLISVCDLKDILAKTSHLFMTLSFLGLGLSLLSQFAVLFLEKLQTVKQEWDLIVTSVFMALTLAISSSVIIVIFVMLLSKLRKVLDKCEDRKHDTEESKKAPAIPSRMPTSALTDLNLSTRGAITGAQTLPKSQAGRYLDVNAILTQSTPVSPISPLDQTMRMNSYPMIQSNESLVASQLFQDSMVNVNKSTESVPKMLAAGGMATLV